jgi:hypothetical protein
MKLAKLQETKPTIRFSANLSRPKANEKTGSWTVTLPNNANAKLPSRGTTMVEGTINGFPFRAALEPNGKGSHRLRVNKTMRDVASADAVDTVTVEITRAGEESEIRVANGSTQSSCSRPAGAGRVGGHHTNSAPRLDFLDKLSQATGNAHSPDRESVRHACLWKATIMLFSRHKVAYEKKRRIMRHVASVADLTKSFFAEIDKVENRKGLEKLRVNIGVARKRFSRQLCVRSHRFENSPYEARALSNI